MPPETAQRNNTADVLAADFMQLSQKRSRTQPAPQEGEGTTLAALARPSLRGNLTKTPRDEQIAAIANVVAKDHNGFTSVAVEKIEMERLTLAIPAATGQELAERAAKARVTKTFLILSALRDAGFDVPEAALVPDGRQRR